MVNQDNLLQNQEDWGQENQDQNEEDYDYHYQEGKCQHDQETKISRPGTRKTRGTRFSMTEGTEQWWPGGPGPK